MANRAQPARESYCRAGAQSMDNSAVATDELREGSHRGRRGTSQLALAVGASASSTAISARARSTRCSEALAGEPADGARRHSERHVSSASVSLIFWSLILVVTVKYRASSSLRADNNGEGGTLALMALAQRAFGGGSGRDRSARHRRRGAVLRRRGDHTGALGALCRRGLEVAAPALEPLRRCRSPSSS